MEAPKSCHDLCSGETGKSFFEVCIQSLFVGPASYQTNSSTQCLQDCEEPENNNFTASPTMDPTDAITTATPGQSYTITTSYDIVQTTDGNGHFTLVTVPITPSTTPILVEATPSSATTPSAVQVTVSVTHTAAASSTVAAPAATTTNNGLSFGAKMAAILVPILVILALIPIIYLIWLSRRNRKRDQQEVPELRFPPETRQLVSNSRRNSESLPSPFADSPGTRSGSLGVIERPSSEILRIPSPTLPSPALPSFRYQEQWPLVAPLPEPLRPKPPPKPIGPTAVVRPPSSEYGGNSPQLKQLPARPTVVPPRKELNISSQRLHQPGNRDSDAVSELSFEQGTSKRRSRKDPDELSLVSALSPDEIPSREFHQGF
jgi:hypothetical protein